MKEKPPTTYLARVGLFQPPVGPTMIGFAIDKEDDPEGPYSVTTQEFAEQFAQDILAAVQQAKRRDAER